MSKTVSVVIADEKKEKLEQMAKEEDRNISYLVRKAIDEFLEKYKP